MPVVLQGVLWLLEGMVFWGVGSRGLGLWPQQGWPARRLHCWLSGQESVSCVVLGLRLSTSVFILPKIKPRPQPEAGAEGDLGAADAHA